MQAIHNKQQVETKQLGARTLRQAQRKPSLIEKGIKNIHLALIRTLLRRKHFFGNYAENMVEIKKFYAQSAIAIIPVQIDDDKIKFTMLLPNTEGEANMIAAKEIIKEQARQHGRKLRKKHKTTLWYAYDTMFSRALGYKHGRLTRSLEK